MPTTTEATYSYSHPSGKMITIVRLYIAEFTKPVQWDAYVDGERIEWNPYDADATFSTRRTAYKFAIAEIEGPNVYAGERLWTANIDAEMRQRQIKTNTTKENQPS